MRVVDVCGDIKNLVGAPLLMAEESSESMESGTWTFYEFATVKGSVTIRWLGESNGYYGEEVLLKHVKGS